MSLFVYHIVEENNKRNAISFTLELVLELAGRGNIITSIYASCPLMLQRKALLQPALSPRIPNVPPATLNPYPGS